MLPLFFIICLAVIHHEVQAVEMLISQPGIYQLSGDIAISPAIADAAIVISANDVTLDLNGYKVQQTNGTAGVDGIVISTGARSITVKNGIISLFSQRGLVVNQNTAAIYLEGLIFERCARAGALFLGINVAPISTVIIKDCQFRGCCQAAGITTNENPLGFSNCLGVEIDNVLIADTSNPNNVNLALLRLDGCGGVFCEQIALKNNAIGNGTLDGVSLNGTNSAVFSDIQVRSNSAGGGSLNGFLVGGAAAAFSNCSVVQNSATIELRGFLLNNTAEYANLLRNCSVIANQSTQILEGISCNGASANFFSECIIAGNSGTNGLQGFFIDASEQGTIQRCIIANNTSGNTAFGIFFSANAVQSWTVVDCVIDSNTGAVASRGIRDDGGPGASQSLFTKNKAFNNGVVASEQYINVPPGSQTTSTTGNLNTNTLPWTNIAVVT